MLVTTAFRRAANNCVVNVETDLTTLRIRIALIPPDTNSVKHRKVSNRGAGWQPARRTTGLSGTFEAKNLMQDYRKGGDD